MYSILNEDFTKSDIGSKKARMIFADPPYGVTRLKYDNDGFDLDQFWSFCKNNLCEDGVVVVTAVFKFAMKVVESAPKNWFRYDLVWHKTAPTGHLNAKKMPMRSHELILVFSPSSKHVYNPQMTHGHKRKVSSAAHKSACRESEVYGHAAPVDYDSTDRYPTSIQTFASDIRKGSFHPNQKPVEMMRWIIRTYTNVGDTIIDPVAGSGTTLIAAYEEGRECICIEKDEQYYQKAVKRIDERMSL